MKRLLIFVALFALAAVGCAKHDDSPPGPLAVVVPPTPQNFTVTSSDFIVWDLGWTVSDASAVRIYYVYAYTALTGVPQLVDSTTSTSNQYSIRDQNGDPVQVPGLVWGVSAISHSNVESRIISGTAQ